MGQQQLLFIILAIIILGVAIVAAVWLYTDTAEDSNRKALILDLSNLASVAQKYYRTPKSTGGGERSFIGFSLPADADKNINGTFEVTDIDDSHVHIVAVGVEKGRDNVTPIRAELEVYASSRNLIELN